MNDQHSSGECLRGDRIVLILLIAMLAMLVPIVHLRYHNILISLGAIFVFLVAVGYAASIPQRLAEETADDDEVRALDEYVDIVNAQGINCDAARECIARHSVRFPDFKKRAMVVNFVKRAYDMDDGGVPL